MTPETKMVAALRGAVVMALSAAALVAMPAAEAAVTTFVQKAGTAGCVSNDGTDGACQDGQGLEQPRGVAVSPDGKSVYVASVLNSVAVLDRDPTTGTLSPGGCVDRDGVDGCTAVSGLDGPFDVAVSPDGATVYVTSFISDAVIIFDRDSVTGDLTRKAGTAGCVDDVGNGVTCADAVALDGPYDVVVSPAGDSVYVTAFGSNAVAVFDRAVDGTLTQKAGTAGCVSEDGTGGGCQDGVALEGPAALSLTDDGTSLYVVTATSHAVAVFDRAVGGTIAQKGGSAGCVSQTGTGGACAVATLLLSPNGIAATPDGGSLYVAAASTGALLVFDRAGSGALTQKPGSEGCVSQDGSGETCVDSNAMQVPSGVAVDPTSSLLYVTTQDRVVIFDRAPAGNVTEKPGISACIADAPVAGACRDGVALQGAHSLAMDDDGSSIYATAEISDAVAVFDAGSLSAPSFTVNRLSDVGDPLIDGNCDVDLAVTGRQCTLRAAIQESPFLAPGALIRVPAGRIELSQGPLVVTDGIRIQGRSAGSSIISGGEASRIFSLDLQDSETFSISRVSLRDGAAAGDGGALSASGGGVTLTDVVVADNHSDDEGGGLAFDADVSTVQLTRVSVRGNDADGGGGVYSEAKLTTIDRSVISGNVAGGDGSGWGGGLFHSPLGEADVLSVTRSRISGNSNTGVLSPGGGIISSGSVQIEDSTISGNQATGDGGALHLDAGIHHLTNVTIADNQAGQHGGGIHLFGVVLAEEALFLDNATVAANTSQMAGGGISVNGGTVTATSAIIATNDDLAGTDDQCNANLVTGGGNVIGVGTNCNLMPVPASSDVTDVAHPLLRELAGNGGPTPTMALRSGSPAIGAGVDCPPADQRGAPRSESCDSGAYERVACHGVLVNRVGTSGKDSLVGTGERDGFLGLAGSDRLEGRGSADALCGGDANDVLRGGGGADVLDGGAGSDRCHGEAGSDRFRRCERRRS